MPRLTFYLDNSSWNHLARGHINSFRNVVAINNSLICYSLDNLREILSTANSNNRIALELQIDNMFAEFVENLGASTSGLPYEASFRVIGHDERWRIYEDSVHYSSVGGFGFLDILQKLIGGIASKSYDDVHEEALQNLTCMLDAAVDELGDGIGKDILNLGFKKLLKDAALGELTQHFQVHEEVRLPELDQVKIANFSGEGTAERVLREAEKSNATGVAEAFLSDVPVSRAEYRKMRANHDQIIRLSQALFFLRYKREAKNMKDNERARRDFQGSMTDLEHIAHSSVCSIFHTSDRAQSQIAAAVYDHLNVSTAVFYYSKKEDTTTVAYQPSQFSMLLEAGEA